MVDPIFMVLLMVVMVIVAVIKRQGWMVLGLAALWIMLYSNSATL